MMRFLADENFSNRILRGLRRENAEADIVRVQDTEIYSADAGDGLGSKRKSHFADTRYKYCTELCL